MYFWSSVVSKGRVNQLHRGAVSSIWFCLTVAQLVWCSTWSLLSPQTSRLLFLHWAQSSFSSHLLWASTKLTLILFFNPIFDKLSCNLKNFSICIVYIQFLYLMDLSVLLSLTGVGLLCHLQQCCKASDTICLFSCYRIQQENKPRTICLSDTLSSPLQKQPISLRHLASYTLFWSSHGVRPFQLIILLL